MKIHALQDAPPGRLGEALERFEHGFRYPLGEGVRFRISHGREYLAFFRAMGHATVWVSECDGEVVGTLAAIMRMLHLPGGRTCSAAYLCDLKVSEGGRAGRVLAQLARAATAELTAKGVASAYAVVMDGTSRTPLCYTGRLGIPGFEEIGAIRILKIAMPSYPSMQNGAARSGELETRELRTRLNSTEVHAEPSRPELRSLMKPVALATPGGDAYGVVEDTRRGKRLWFEEGGEMLAAHLSQFTYRSIDAGAYMVRAALRVAEEAGFPALFCALPAGDAPQVAAALGDLDTHVAPATIYGHGLPALPRWRVDSSEI